MMAKIQISVEEQIQRNGWEKYIKTGFTSARIDNSIAILRKSIEK